MANPQIEDGHVDLANEIIEALAKIRISGEEMQCLWVIFRKTYGWHKKEDNIALSQFCEFTGLKKPAVCRSISKLLSKKIIVVIKKDNGISTYRFNKDFDIWQPLSKKITLSKKIMTINIIDNESLSKKRHTKETIQKKLLQKKEQKLCDDDFWKEVRGIYIWVNVDEQIAKMKGYQLTPRGKNWKMTKRSVISWLNRIDKPLEIQEDDPYKNLEYVKGGNKEEVIQ